LQQDRALLNWLRGSGNAADPVPLRVTGAGLFYREGAFPSPFQNNMHGQPETRILGVLRQQIEQRHGRDFLQRRKQQVVRQIQQMTPPAWDVSWLNSTADTDVPRLYSFSGKYRDLLAALLALTVLQEARPLLDGALVASPDAALRLNAAEISRLRLLRKKLRGSLLQLLDSRRPDWGYALLVTCARLIVVEHSIHSGYLAAVDVFADDSPVIGQETAKKYAVELRMQLADALQDVQREKAALQRRHDFSETDYSYLERAVNRYVELLQGLRHDRTMRVSGWQLLPVRSVYPSGPVLPALTDRQITRALRRIDDFERRYLQLLRQRYRYNLLTRNCVTELFRTMQNAFLENSVAGESSARQPDAVAKRESRMRLGGYVEPLPVNFIPFVSYQAVQRQYHAADSQKLPSYRLGRLEQLYARENAAWVAMREGNTLSSTLYKYNDEDSFFIFFTDDTVLLRPFYGAVNTVAGVAESVLGLLALPFDSGKTLKSGVVGILMSLPELAFFNMRKGTYRFLPDQTLALSELDGRQEKN